MTQDVHKRAAAGSMLNRTDHSIDSEDNHPRREYLIGRATEVSVPGAMVDNASDRVAGKGRIWRPRASPSRLRSPTRFGTVQR